MLNQNFPVIYKSKQFMVDPICLCNASRKFHDLIQSLSNETDEARKMKLEIVYDHFSERNVENFLRLCQNLPTDCQNSEIKEICQIAKMFQADQIYNTGISFVHKSLDPNFNVSDQQFNGHSFLVLSPITKKLHHFSDMNSLEFDDDDNQTENNQENVDPNKGISNEIEKEIPKNNDVHSVVYQIKENFQLMKKPIYQFISNGKVILTAKRDNNLIVIGNGTTIHLNKDKSNHIGRIIMDNGINNVFCENQSFQIKYVYLTGPKSFSMDTEFVNRGTKLHWKPKMPKYNNATNSYTLSLGGEYHRRSIKSNINTILTNELGEWCAIIRKVAEFQYEIECNPRASQTIVFAIALSQIIGPNPSYSNFIKM